MSALTEVVVVCGSLPRAKVAEVVALDFGDGQHLAELDTEHAGGHKVFCDTVFAACFNHVIPETVKERLATIDWGWVQPVVIIDWEYSEDDESYEVWHPERKR